MNKTPKQVQLISFGFKYGQPACNFVFDVSFLKNPARCEGKSLGAKVDEEMQQFVLEQPLALEMIKCIVSTARIVIESGDRMRLGIGCSGGLHRSQVISGVVYDALKSEGYDVELLHRELGEC